MKTYKFLVKNTLEIERGEYNGYVIIPQEHPYYAKSYWILLILIFMVD